MKQQVQTPASSLNSTPKELKDANEVKEKPATEVDSSKVKTPLPKKKIAKVVPPKKPVPKPKERKVVAEKKPPPPKQKIIAPVKKPVLPPKPIASKPIYVPKKLISPQPNTAKLQAPPLQKARESVKSLTKPTVPIPLPKSKPKLAKKSLPKPQLSPLPTTAKKRPKIQPNPVLKKIPNTPVPKFPTQAKKYTPPKIVSPKNPKDFEQLTSLPSETIAAPKNPKPVQNIAQLNDIKIPDAVRKPEDEELPSPIDLPLAAKIEKIENLPNPVNVPTAPKSDILEPPMDKQKPMDIVPEVVKDSQNNIPSKPDLNQLNAPSKLAPQGLPPEGNPNPGLGRFRLQQAQASYNAQIYTAINKNFYAPENYKNLNVQIEITIGLDGELLEYRLMQSSGIEAFDLTAINAVKTTQLPPLPGEISKNPPYIVMLKF
ncbi:MAG: TonB C-terminal domain-containing protein [SAR324 cluster bacterium]|nr:TonB C-terminal domain-containing protein [SAR324 cluster bacterium]